MSEQMPITPDGNSGQQRAGVALADAKPSSPQPSSGDSGRRSRLRRILVPLLSIVVVVVAIVGFNYYWNDEHYVSTDNAQVSGQEVPVGSMNTGRIVTLSATVGAQVHKGDVLAQVALPSEVGTSQSGQPKLDFLGGADTRVDVKSPIDGEVIAVSTAVGATVAPGEPLVTLVDPTQLWVNANIDETKISRVRVGQDVDVHLDALNATIPGKVEALTPATASTFSLLPQSNTSSNFTKVTQVVPVRIAVNLGSQPGLLGSSASVQIHVE